MVKVNRKPIDPNTRRIETKIPKIGQKQLEQSRKALMLLRSGAVNGWNDEKCRCKSYCKGCCR